MPKKLKLKPKLKRKRTPKIPTGLSAYISKVEKEFKPFFIPHPNSWDTPKPSKNLKSLHRQLSLYHKSLKRKKKRVLKNSGLKSLQEYVGWSESHNYRLRKIKNPNILKKADKKSYIDKNILDLWNLVTKFKVSNITISYRGMIDLQYEVGKRYQNPCFISTSINESVAHGFRAGAMIQYIVPKGHHGVYVPGVLKQYVGNDNFSEMELILPPLTEFVIVSKERIQDVNYYKAVIVPNEFKAKLA
jgi:ADP-ribosyltransferase exoenzyme